MRTFRINAYITNPSVFRLILKARQILTCSLKRAALGEEKKRLISSCTVAPEEIANYVDVWVCIHSVLRSK